MLKPVERGSESSWKQEDSVKVHKLQWYLQSLLLLYSQITGNQTWIPKEETRISVEKITYGSYRKAPPISFQRIG